MFTTEQRSSGLVIARDGMDERSVSAQLKQLDRRLVLQKHPRDGAPGGWVWKVICVVSDTQAPVVFTWLDEFGNPLPLSSGLVDAVHSHLVGSRHKPIDEDEHNRRLVAQKQADVEREAEALRDDHRPYIERGRVGVSMATTKKPRYWRRENATPRSGKTR